MALQRLVIASILVLMAGLLLLGSPASAAVGHASSYTCEEQTGPGPDATIVFNCYSTTFGRTCIVWVGGGGARPTCIGR